MTLLNLSRNSFFFSLSALWLLSNIFSWLWSDNSDPITAFPITIEAVTFNECRQRDSLALVAFYNATQEYDVGGETGWRIKWDTLQPMDTWYGVRLDENGCVSTLSMPVDDILGANRVRGELPPEIGNLLDLDTLNILTAQFDTIPNTLWNLTDLEYLRFGGTLFQNARLSSEIENLTNLTELIFSATPGLTGPIPPEIGNLTQLKHLRLRADFTGDIPASLGNLFNLERLWIFGNDQLGGSIPPELGQLTNLKTLSLYGNALTGNIPPELGDLSISALYLYRNELSGPIPGQLGQLNLNYIDLSENQLIGKLPLGLFTQNLNPLSFFVQNNDLSGSIPAEITNLTNLRRVDLSNNQFSGELPPGLAALQSNNANFNQLTLNNNQLTGCFPTQYAAFCAVDSVNFSNNTGLTGGGDFVAFCADGTGSCNSGCNDATTIPLNTDPCGRKSVVALLENVPPSANPPVGSCAITSYAGNSIWFKVIVPNTGNLLVKSQESTNIQPVMEAYLDCNGPLSPLICQDMSLAAGVFLIDLEPTDAGQEVFLQLWDHSNTVVNSATEAQVELTAHILSDNPDDWELCDFPEPESGTAEQGSGQRSAKQFIIQYPKNATQEEINARRAVLQNEVGAVRVDSCNCRANPIELWEAVDPIDLEEKVRGARSTADVDTSEVDYNYLIRDAFCLDSLRQFQVDNSELALTTASEVGMNSLGQSMVIWGSEIGLHGQILASDGSKVGNEITISNNPGFDADVAVDGSGNAYVVWTEEGGSCSSTILMQKYDPNGNEIGVVPDTISPCVEGITRNSDPSISIDGAGNYLIFWVRQQRVVFTQGEDFTIYLDNDVMGTRFDSEGNSGITYETEDPSGVPPSDQFAPEVAMSAQGRSVVVWRENPESGPNSILGRAFTVSGGLTGPRFQVNDSLAPLTALQGLDVAMSSSGTFAVTWDEVRFGGSGEMLGSDVFVRTYDENGLPTKEPIDVFPTSSDEFSSRIAMLGNGDFMVAWQDTSTITEEGDIYAQAFNIDGVSQRTPFRVNTLTEGIQGAPSLATDGDAGYIVSWGDQTKENIYGQRYRDLAFDELSYPVPFSGQVPCLEVLAPIAPEPIGEKYVPINPQTRVRVAVLDAGIEQTHSFFEHVLWQNPNPEEGCTPGGLIGFDFVDDDAEPEDNTGHGTAVNGVIASGFPGDIGLELMNPKFYDVNRGTLFDAVCGLYYAIEEGADIINLSWGFESRDFPNILQEAVDLAEEKGILIVTSAGNEGDDNDGLQKYPANFENNNIIVVASYELDQETETPKLSAYSNYGDEKVALAAPGYFETASLNNATQAVVGTSIAAPRVARLAAIVKGTYPQLSALDIKDCILSGCTEATSLGNKIVGNRILDTAAESRVLNCAAEKADQMACLDATTLITETVSTEITYQSMAVIESTSHIETGADVIFSATERISLLPGFRVDEGAYFLGTLQGCSFGELRETTPEEVSESNPLEWPSEPAELMNKDSHNGSIKWRVAPNPFASMTQISFYVPAPTRVLLTVHDLHGQILATLENSTPSEGWYETTLRSDKLPGGTYILRLQSAWGIAVQKVVHLK